MSIVNYTKASIHTSDITLLVFPLLSMGKHMKLEPSEPDMKLEPETESPTPMIPCWNLRCSLVPFEQHQNRARVNIGYSISSSYLIPTDRLFGCQFTVN
jgi:hypothetical protein